MAETPKPSPIDRLLIKDYSAKPRLTYGFVGQNASIRPIDFTDQTDMQRVRAIQDLQQKDFFTKEDLSDRQIINWLKNKSNTMEHLVFGISGNKGIRYNGDKKETIALPEEEQGEIQGWIMLDHLPKKEAARLVKEGVIPQPYENQPPFYLAYANFPGTEENPTANGQMASALREVFSLIGSLDYTLSSNRIEAEARKALRIDSDKKLGDLSTDQLIKLRKLESTLWKQHPGKPTQSVIATISPRNPQSMRAAEAAGMVRSNTRAEGIIEGDLDYVYVLDWDKHQQLMLNAALEEKRQMFQKPGEVQKMLRSEEKTP